ncbi:hypothetical protein [Tepidibacter hydrothermalis]|uniref:Regulatory protein YycH domain-containing protein n=1 Tax=Tepidibacter hydrothermalis TaxID=3036126 RepID=A0ABY8EHB5_9FIRM|nr:hypothetical protein [Tepidibacter hydrothermalis]WFD10230.1 hypothetical protein P4S50_18020 [Tepidibacter hydrothermalis]
MNREKFKTFTLAILFSMSAFLLLLNISLVGFKFDLKKIYGSPNIKYNIYSVVRPYRVFVYFGGGKNNTEVLDTQDDYWNQIKIILKQELSKQKKISEISYEDYLSKKNMKSIEANFDKGIDVELINKSIFLNESAISDIGDICEILIPLVDDKSIYFLNNEQKVYKVDLDKVKHIDLVDKLEKKGYTEYFTVDSLFTIDNKTLIPIKLDGISYDNISSKNIIDVKDDKLVQKIGENILGNKYDFTNRIVEKNGNNTFIYGYGEKTLRIYNNGYIEFLNEDIDNKNIDLDKSLSIALDFLANQNIGIDNLSLYSIEKNSINNINSYEFNFYYEVNNLKLKIDNVFNSIQIKIAGEDIYSYKGVLKEVDQFIDGNTDNNIIPPDQILNMNFSLLKKDLKYQSGEEVWKNIKGVELIYFSKDDYFIPSWKVTIGNSVYIFDAYKGDVL